MTPALSRRSLLAGAGALACTPAVAAETPSPAMQAVLDYVQAQRTTGFLITRDGRTLVERNWAVRADAGRFRAFTYETTADGALLEDVASQQKSFVAVLMAIAADKGLLDVAGPVSDYVAPGWSKAGEARERAIRILDLLTMTSGLDETLAYVAPAGSVFLYNTPAYAVTKRVLSAAAKQPLEEITRTWLTAPLRMTNTGWRKRPAAFGDVGNPTGLVTSPRDVAALGQLVLDGGRAADGRRVVSEAGLQAMLAPTIANPAYGRLWWLNGSGHTTRPPANRTEGPLIPAAPVDLVAALGALDRKLYVVPGQRVVAVRLGEAAIDKDFDQQLWLRLSKALV